MDRLEKIRQFAEKRNVEENAKKIQYTEDVDNCVERIMERLDRVIYLCSLAKECRKNKISLGEEQDIIYSKGSASKCFISNGWSHRMGFDRNLNAVGFYAGGAMGDENMFLMQDGTLIKPKNKNYEISFLKS